MKCIRRILMLLLIVFFLFQLCCVSAAQGEDDTETESSQMEKLQALGLWVSDISTEAVTRGEFAQLMAALQGMNQEEIKNTPWEDAFSDVDSTHKAYGAVSFLTSQGILEGEENQFYPDRPITYYEAVKMLAGTLGYKAAAEANGGYPAGYLKVARQYDLIPDGESGDKVQLSAVYCAELIECAMDAKLMEPVYTNRDTTWVTTDNTALQAYHQIGTAEGILEAAGSLSLLRDSQDLDGDTLIIGQERFTGDGTAMRKYVGYRVTAYFETGADQTDKPIIYLEPTPGLNRISEISEESLIGYEDGTIIYENAGGKVSRVFIGSDDVRILFNDELTEPTDESISTADSFILIYNGSGSPSVVFAEKWDIYVTDSLDHIEHILTDRFWENAQRLVYLGENDGENSVAIQNHLGVPSDFYAIKKNTVLRVKQSPSERQTSIIITNVVKEGVLNAFDSDGETLTLDDTEYNVASKSIAPQQLQEAKPGYPYILYLDDLFRVVALERQVNTEEQYGYMISAETEGAFKDTAYFWMFTADNEFKEIQSADRIRVDGEVMKNGADIVAALAGDTGIERQPVRYRLNDSGEITYLDTVKLGAHEQSNGTFRGNPTLTKYDAFTGGRFIGDPIMFGAETYNPNDNTQYNVKMTAKTPVFCVPPFNATDEQIWDKDNYYVTNVRIFENYDTYKENATTGERVEAYDLSENWTAGLIVYYTQNTTAEPITDKTPITVVEEIVQGLDDEGNPQSYLHGFQAGNYVSVPIRDGFENLTKEYYAGDGTVTSTVRFGDVIRFSLDSQGRIDDYEKVFSLTDEDNPEYVKWGNEVNSTNTFQNNPSLVAWSEGYTDHGYSTPFVYKAKEAFEAEYRVVFGTLKERVGNNIVLSVGGEAPMTIVGDIQRYNVLLVDEERQEMYMPDLNAFQPESIVGAENASQILLHTSKGSSRTVVLVKRAK